MNHFDLLSALAKEIGFEEAAPVPVSALAFREDVRKMCEQNRCRHYNKSWSCPPACGTLADSAAKASRYQNCVLVQTVGKMEDEFDYESISDTSALHKERFEAFCARAKETLGDILPMGAGGCTVCQTCTYPDAPCRFPDRRITSMEAYGLMVSDVCTAASLPYYHGINTVTFVSCVLY